MNLLDKAQQSMISGGWFWKKPETKVKMELPEINADYFTNFTLSAELYSPYGAFFGINHIALDDLNKVIDPYLSKNYTLSWLELEHPRVVCNDAIECHKLMVYLTLKAIMKL